MKMSFRTKILTTVALACVICTASAVFVSRNAVHRVGVGDLGEKSSAILSRTEVARDYIASMGTLEGVVQETLKKFPDGRVSDEQKEKVLKSVPIYAAFKVGQEGAEKEHYQFRIFAEKPRRPGNLATADELKYFEKFKSDPSLKELVEEAPDGSSIRVMRPVRISQAQGCLTCHGHPSTSPWANGKDILGYPMEDLKDGELRAVFAIVSSLGPVHADTQAATKEIAIWGAVFTLIALLLGYFGVRGPIGTLTMISNRLSGSGEELRSASQEISAVSRELSANSSEASASLTETVSSMEEMSSMVNRNTDSAKEAAELSQKSRTSGERSESELKELLAAINEISTSSKKIEEIINVIDDIAFQTNLLALNAAVEAARAGEQGKGFAVVAEAVRSLAQRSADAAKDISGLIRESVSKVDRGAKIAAATGDVLREVVGSVNKVSELNQEIATASVEQSRGVEQIGKALNQLDAATQQNAAAANESSSSANLLTKQAEQIADLVRELTAVVGASESESPRRRTPPPTSSRGGARAENVIPFDSTATRTRSDATTSGSTGKVGTTDGF